MPIATCSGRRPLPYAPERKYTPVDAPREKLFALRDFLGFDRNVIVQASCHGTDNAALVDALVNSGNKARGVAVINEQTAQSELESLDKAGVRGVRFNFLKRLADFTPRDVLERIAARIAPMGWHVVVYFEMPDLPELESFFTSLPTIVVVDHMGRPDVRKDSITPRISVICGCSTSTEFLEQGQRPRTSHLRALRRRCCAVRAHAGRALSGRVLWGTDWPHPNMPVEAPDDGVLVDVIPKIATTPALQKALLVDNPMKLYWA